MLYEAQLALLEVDGHLFSDQEIHAFEGSSWPDESHLVPNRMEGAWDALKDAVTNTELVARLHAQGKDGDLLRSVTESVLHKITVMLRNSSPLVSKRERPKPPRVPRTTKTDPRVATWTEQLAIWKRTILPTALPSNPDDLRRRLEACKNEVERLVEEKARLQPLGSVRATDLMKCKFRGGLLDCDLSSILWLQESSAQSAAEAVTTRIKAGALAKSRSAGLVAINAMMPPTAETST